MTTVNLKPNEYHEFYSTYINKVPKELELIAGFIKGGAHLIQFFKELPADKLEYRYAEGKWSIKEVLQHIIDTERVFMYRCFRIARRDKTPLAGFEQDDYINPSQGHNKALKALLEEYEVGRKNAIVLLKSLGNEDLQYIGKASGCNMSARAIAFATIGHELHHIDILKERYL
ncbi:DinB family protein [Postechiella marina]|uniref:DinB family protein n=1 Tax=Postechiella marina TaxID=943941 RepID=A0ABP8C090_9FLAO